jgi:hypothetical protein
LFYNLIDNPTSSVVIDVFGKVSRSIAGPFFGFVDLRANPDVALAFNKLASDTDNPFNKFAYNKVPFIINYRGGWPTETYQGNMNEEELRNFALNVSCRRGMQKTLNTSESTMVPKVELIAAQMEMRKCQEESKRTIDTLAAENARFVEIINNWKEYSDRQTETIRALQRKLGE